VKLLELLLGEGWEITPAGGATGEAYYAQKGEEKLFLKRNSSPFLAVLSAEGIVPKLLWTRRLENGDVITAQRWVSGRELKSSEMKGERVTQLLRKIHRSKELLEMFKRIGNKPLTPQLIVNQISIRMSETKFGDELFKKALYYLQEQISEVEYHEYVVCHCDINHNNWVLSEKDQLFLIDWDGAMFADPALDLGLLLYWYIPVNEWSDLLSEYGVKFDDHLSKRMHWYVISQTIYAIFWHKERHETAQLNYWRRYLAELLEVDIVAKI
jgi:thiamine kinase-like enzyme